MALCFLGHCNSDCAAAVPGIAPVILIGLEIWMTIQISKSVQRQIGRDYDHCYRCIAACDEYWFEDGGGICPDNILCFMLFEAPGRGDRYLGVRRGWDFIEFFDRIVYEGGFELIW